MSIKKYSSTINIFLIVVLLIGFGMSSTIVPFLASGPDRVFAGFHGYSADYVGYVSYIKEGMYGHLAMNFRSFPPIQPATPIHWEYILAGIIFAPFGIEAPVIYHLLRVVFGSLLIISVYSLFHKLFLKHNIALISTILAFTSSCVGWLSVTSGAWEVKILNFFPFFISTPQRATDRPHYLLGSLVFLFAFRLLLQQKSNFRIVILLGITSFITIMVHVSSGIVLAMLSGVLILSSIMSKQSKSESHVDRNNGLASLFGALLAAGISYYFIRQYSAVSDIFLDKYTYSASVTLLGIWKQILSFGPLLWIGITGLWVQMFQKDHVASRIKILMLCWGSIHLLLFFFLYPIFRVDQVRFIQSLYYIPLAYGTVWLLYNAKNRYNKHILVIGILAIFLLTFPTYFAQLNHDLRDMTDYKTFAPFGFPTKNQFAAYKFLDSHTPIESTVLADYDAANMILLYSHNKVLGNDQGWTQENGIRMKSEVINFLSGRMPEKLAYEYLQKNNVSYVYEGYRERGFGTITHYSFLERTYSNSEVTIYRVK